MTHFTGYLLGKVQLDGAIRSEVLASLVQTLIQKHQTIDLSKKQFKFNENHKYSVECSERGLKLTAPGCRSKDEGFESDCESIPSVRVTEAVSLDISDLIGHLEIKDNKETDSASAPSSPGGSMGHTDSTGIQLSSSSDDNNSSSGNGSDSDEFGHGGEQGGNRSPYWETLPNLSSFQSYPIEDVVFCHSDTFHPSTLVWVVRHLEKMIALVTAFRTRSEAEELFHTYRDLRVKLKPLKYKINPVLGLKIPQHPTNSASVSSSSPSSSTDESFASLPPSHVYPTQTLHESPATPSLFSEPHPHSTLGFFRGSDTVSSASSQYIREHLSRTGSNSLSLHNHVYVSNPNIVRFGGDDMGNCSSSEDNSGEIVDLPQRPQRKVFNGSNTMSKATIKSAVQQSQKPLLMVPLKNESVSAPKSTYPKESYLYQVMGRSSSTFAPYQRSLNFLPHQFPSGAGGDYMGWGANGGNGHLLVPFSSWLELSELTKQQQQQQQSGSRKGNSSSKGRNSSRLNARTLGAKGTTSKILLRDAAGRDSMWASLSQRFKKNVRENLMPKLNGMWSQEAGGRKKRPNKKVTFNAWATVQMV